MGLTSKIFKTFAFVGIAGLATMIVVGKGCNKEDEIYGSRAKMLKISAISYDGTKGPEMRFYDTDSDMKTVEQYVVVYGANDAYSAASEVRVDMLKKGKKPFFDRANESGLQRIMTEEEQQSIDSKYQRIMGELMR